jgi:cation transport ATPase
MPLVTDLEDLAAIATKKTTTQMTTADPAVSDASPRSKALSRVSVSVVLLLRSLARIEPEASHAVAGAVIQTAASIAAEVARPVRNGNRLPKPPSLPE